MWQPFYPEEVLAGMDCCSMRRFFLEFKPCRLRELYMVKIRRALKYAEPRENTMPGSLGISSEPCVVFVWQGACIWKSIEFVQCLGVILVASGRCVVPRKVACALMHMLVCWSETNRRTTIQVGA